MPGNLGLQAIARLDRMRFVQRNVDSGPAFLDLNNQRALALSLGNLRFLENHVIQLQHHFHKRLAECYQLLLVSIEKFGTLIISHRREPRSITSAAL